MTAHILEDTRNKADKHQAKHSYFESHNISFLRSKVPFGDYCLPPRVAVDTKMDIYELAMDIDQEHQRFKNEMVTAREYGCKLYILVENTANVRSVNDLALWSEDSEHYRMRLAQSIKARRIEGSRLSKACITLSERYGATFLFCHPDESAAKIMEILTDGMDKTR